MEAHRVRYSAPFFYNPNYDALVTPLPLTCGASPQTTAAGASFSMAGQAAAEADVASEVSATSETVSATVEAPSALAEADAAAVVKPLYGAIRWGDYRNMRFQGDFKDVGEEVQIEHFHA